MKTRYKNVYRAIDGMEKDFNARITKLREQVKVFENWEAGHRQASLPDVPEHVLPEKWRDYALSRWKCASDFEQWFIRVPPQAAKDTYYNMTKSKLDPDKVYEYTMELWPSIQVITQTPGSFSREGGSGSCSP